MDGAGLGVLLQWAFSRDAREHVPLKLGGGGLGSVAVLPEVGGVCSDDVARKDPVS